MKEVNCVATVKFLPVRVERTTDRYSISQLKRSKRCELFFFQAMRKVGYITARAELVEARLWNPLQREAWACFDSAQHKQRASRSSEFFSYNIV